MIEVVKFGLNFLSIIGGEIASRRISKVGMKCIPVNSLWGVMTEILDRKMISVRKRGY